MKKRSIFAFVFIIFTGVFISWPILIGGYLTYVDNPVHLAEIYSLAASETGWSDLAFNGFPLIHMHSPLFYGIIVEGVRAGLNAEFLYKFFLILGYLAPSFALYFTGNKNGSIFYTTIVSCFFLLLHYNFTGISSPLGGMWTFGISISLFILLIKHLESDLRQINSKIYLCLLITLIGLTHLFTLVASIIYLAVSFIVDLISKKLTFWHAVHSICFAGLGIIGAAWYLIPAVEYLSHGNNERNVWGLYAIFTFFAFPINLISAVQFSKDGLFSESLLAFTSIASLCIGSFVFLNYFLPGKIQREANELLKLFIFITIISFLLVANSVFNLTFLGPVPWRFVLFIFTAVFLAVIRHPVYLGSVSKTVIVAILLIATLNSQYYLNKQILRLDSTELNSVKTVWSNIAKLDKGRRIYIQDTFWTKPYETNLTHSHILSLTQHETGMNQLGPYYGIVPFRNKRSSISESDLLFGKEINLGTNFAQRLLSNMQEMKCSYLLISNPQLSPALEESKLFNKLFSTGRFTLFSISFSDKEGGYGDYEEAGIGITKVSDGKYRLSFKGALSERRVIKLLVSYHPYWKSTKPDALLTADDSGNYMQVTIPQGTKDDILLNFEPPHFPKYISFTFLGTICIYLILVHLNIIKTGFIKNTPNV
jgi:hypothetical protein